MISVGMWEEMLVIVFQVMDLVQKILKMIWRCYSINEWETLVAGMVKGLLLFWRN